MSRKHFKAVAELLTKFQGLVSADSYHELVSAFGDLFEESNPKFDRAKFYKAVFYPDSK